MNVGNDAARAVAIEIAEVVGAAEAGAVAAVVVDDDDVALRGAVVHEFVITLTVFGHAVDELEYGFGTVGHAQADAELEAVVLTFESKFGAFNHKFIIALM